jgi:hypothetical protein
VVGPYQEVTLVTVGAHPIPSNRSRGVRAISPSTGSALQRRLPVVDFDKVEQAAKIPGTHRQAELCTGLIQAAQKECSQTYAA